MNNEKTCFNCVSGDQSILDAGIPCETTSCKNDNVDADLFGNLDEYQLPDYCGKHEFKQESNT